MKKNKLQDYANKSLEKYDNPELKKQIITTSVNDHECVIDNTKRNWIISLSIIVLIILSAFGSYMLFRPTNKAKEYLLENQTSTEITLEQLTIDSPKLIIKQDLINTIKQVYDIKYNETLYYDITFLDNSTGEMLEIIINTNSHYDYDFVHENLDQYFDNFKMNYIEQSLEEDGIYTFDCIGEINIDSINLYIKYEGLSLEAQSNFINFLQQCIVIDESADL